MRCPTGQGANGTKLKIRPSALTERIPEIATPRLDTLKLLGTKAVGHAQEQHEFLYWEYGRMTAVREGDWKVIRPAPDKPWELYDLSVDPSEANSIADAHPERLAKMVAWAKSSQSPALRPRNVIVACLDGWLLRHRYPLHQLLTVAVLTMPSGE